MRVRSEAQAAAGVLVALLERMPPPPCSAAPDLWFSDRPADRARAARGCRDCAIALECHAFAVANNENFGTWGGEFRAVAVPERAEKERTLLTVGRANPKEIHSA